MVDLSELLDSEQLKDLARASIKIGDVYYMNMTVKNGIVPKDGYNSRNKYFIVLGMDDAGNVYGGVIINSNINKNLNHIIRDYQMPIKCSKYKFLRYDSYVDCTKLKIAYIEKFKEWSYVGTILKEDTDLIIGTLRESPVESPDILEQFKLMR